MFHRYLIVSFLTFIITACGTATFPSNNHDFTTSTVAEMPTSFEDATSRSSNQDVLTAETLNQLPPKDIIQEIGYFGGLGGGEEGDCLNENSPTISGFPESPTELMQQIVISACGLPPGEEVTVTVEMPNGEEHESRMLPEETDSQNRGYIIYQYVPMPYEPIGQYKFIFTGKHWSLEYPQLINSPSHARLYLYESKLYFLHFAPSEMVRLLVYLPKNPELLGHDEFKEFYGWAQYQVDDNGELQIKADISYAEYVAVGEVTGAVNHRLPDDYYEAEWFSVYCAGAPNPIGIKPDKYAEVLVESIPSYQYDFSNGSWLQEGQISLGKGSTFIPESGTDGPYLRPIDYIPSTSTPASAKIPACLGTKPTRLHVGMNAEVTASGMAPQLSLRTQPQLNAEQVHVIAAGRDMVILQGPV